MKVVARGRGYLPQIQQAGLGDKLSDRFLGTNKVDTINNANRYEYQKATNINKYSWNVQGMTQAGINPIANASATGDVAQSAGGSDQDTDMGEVIEGTLSMVKDLLHEVSPASMIKQNRLETQEMNRFNHQMERDNLHYERQKERDKSNRNYQTKRDNAHFENQKELLRLKKLKRIPKSKK